MRRVDVERRNNRYYDPQTGRYLAPDPLPPGVNHLDGVYWYAAGNPIYNSDPTGRELPDAAEKQTYELAANTLEKQCADLGAAAEECKKLKGAKAKYDVIMIGSAQLADLEKGSDKEKLIAQKIREGMGATTFDDGRVEKGRYVGVQHVYTFITPELATSKAAAAAAGVTAMSIDNVVMHEAGHAMVKATGGLVSESNDSAVRWENYSRPQDDKRRRH
jgi:uncharacterized protein RhaS with RHS repeats